MKFRYRYHVNASLHLPGYTPYYYDDIFISKQRIVNAKQIDNMTTMLVDIFKAGINNLSHEITENMISIHSITLMNR